MDFMKEYEKWLASPALSDAERAELESIRNDPKEIESRFYGPLEFGTAGLRGIMAVGLVVAFIVSLLAIRWLTGFVRRHDFKVFGWYRIVLGVVVLAYFLVVAPALSLA